MSARELDLANREKENEMSSQYRYSRPEPPRTGPRRSFSLTYDHPGPASSWTTTPNAPSGGGRIDGVIANAVDLGYRVIEEQLQQGQQAARQLRHSSFNSRAIDSDINTVIDSLSRVTKGAIDAWADLLGAARRGDPASGLESNGGVAFSIQVKSARPAHVTLDLSPPSGRFVPVIPELKSATPGRKPFTGARFVMNLNGERGALVITIPDDIAPGLYSGDILDSVTRQFGGTVSVRIDP
jgi:hypothetical protein